MLRGFAAIGVASLVVLGFQNCAQPNSISPIDLAIASPVPGPVAQIYLGSNASVPQGAWTKIPMASVEYDTDASLNAANSRLVPLKAGIYRVHLTASLSMTGTSGFTIYAAVFKNGAASKQIAHLINYPAGFNQSLSVDALVSVNGTTDYIEGYAYSNSGAANVIAGPTNTWLSVEYVRAQ